MKRPPSRAWCMLVLGTCLAVAACSRAPQVLEFESLDGTRHAPQQVAAGQVHVVVFTSHECPIANAYAPTLASLARAWATQPVHLYLVHVGAGITPDGAREHARAFALPGTLLLDPAQQLARALGATRTPEAVVLDAAGLVYRGRIDDQWRAPGSRAPAANRHDLRDAVAAALAGRKVPLPHPEAVGCLLPERAHGSNR